MNLLLILVFVVVFALIGLVAFTARTARRVEAGLPPTGRFVDLPGARLHIVEKGDETAPPLLMIHGLGGNLRHFSYGLVDELASQFRVIAVDRPGAGWSDRKPGASAALGAQADLMAALIDQLHLARKPVVIGHSLGGAISLALAQRHPDKIAALALIAPLTHAPSRISPAFKGLMVPPWARAPIAWTLALPASIAKREAVLGEVFGPEPIVADFGIRGGALLGVRPANYIGACTDLAEIGTDLPAMMERYATMQLPVAVLYGRGDRLLDPAEQGQALVDKIAGARLVLVDGGHMLPLTQVGVSANFIRDFVGTLDTAREPHEDVNA